MDYIDVSVILFIESNYAKDFAFAFLSVLYEGLPFIFIGTLISGFIDVYLPARFLEKFLPKNRILSIFICGLLGIIVPVCECTVVPVIRRLVAKGLPIGSAFAYMLAAPIVNPITFFSTYTAFAGEPLSIAVSRSVIGYLVAVTVGLTIYFLPTEKVLKKAVIDKLNYSGVHHSHAPKTPHDNHSCNHSAVSCCGHDHKEEAEKHCCDHDSSHDHNDNIVSALRTSVKDFIDVALYFVIGVCLMTVFKMAANTQNFLNYLADQGSLIEGSLFMIALSFVLSLCSTSDAFVVATSFERIGRVPKMVFLVYGPMMDVKLFFLYQTLMKFKSVIGLLILLLVLTIIFTHLWGSVFVDVRSLIEDLFVTIGIKEGGGI